MNHSQHTDAAKQHRSISDTLFSAAESTSDIAMVPIFKRLGKTFSNLADLHSECADEASVLEDATTAAMDEPRSGGAHHEI